MSSIAKATLIALLALVCVFFHARQEPAFAAELGACKVPADLKIDPAIESALATETSGCPGLADAKKRGACYDAALTAAGGKIGALFNKRVADVFNGVGEYAKYKDDLAILKSALDEACPKGVTFGCVANDMQRKLSYVESIIDQNKTSLNTWSYKFLYNKSGKPGSDPKLVYANQAQSVEFMRQLSDVKCGLYVPGPEVDKTKAMCLDKLTSTIERQIHVLNTLTKDVHEKFGRWRTYAVKCSQFWAKDIKAEEKAPAKKSASPPPPAAPPVTSYTPGSGKKPEGTKAILLDSPAPKGPSGTGTGTKGTGTGSGTSGTGTGGDADAAADGKPEGTSDGDPNGKGVKQKKSEGDEKKDSKAKTGDKTTKPNTPGVAIDPNGWASGMGQKGDPKGVLGGKGAGAGDVATGGTDVGTGGGAPAGGGGGSGSALDDHCPPHLKGYGRCKTGGSESSADPDKLGKKLNDPWLYGEMLGDKNKNLPGLSAKATMDQFQRRLLEYYADLMIESYTQQFMVSAPSADILEDGVQAIAGAFACLKGGGPYGFKKVEDQVRRVAKELRTVPGFADNEKAAAAKDEYRKSMVYAAMCRYRIPGKMAGPGYAFGMDIKTHEPPKINEDMVKHGGFWMEAGDATVFNLPIVRKFLKESYPVPGADKEINKRPCSFLMNSALVNNATTVETPITPEDRKHIESSNGTPVGMSRREYCQAAKDQFLSYEHQMLALHSQFPALDENFEGQPAYAYIKSKASLTGLDDHVKKYSIPTGLGGSCIDDLKNNNVPIPKEALEAADEIRAKSIGTMVRKNVTGAIGDCCAHYADCAAALVQTPEFMNTYLSCSRPKFTMVTAMSKSPPMSTGLDKDACDERRGWAPAACELWEDYRQKSARREMISEAISYAMDAMTLAGVGSLAGGAAKGAWGLVSGQVATKGIVSKGLVGALNWTQGALVSGTTMVGFTAGQEALLATFAGGEEERLKAYHAIMLCENGMGGNAAQCEEARKTAASLEVSLNDKFAKSFVDGIFAHGLFGLHGKPGAKGREGHAPTIETVEFYKLGEEVSKIEDPAARVKYSRMMLDIAAIEDPHVRKVVSEYLRDFLEKNCDGGKCKQEPNVVPNMAAAKGAKLPKGVFTIADVAKGVAAELKKTSESAMPGIKVVEKSPSVQLHGDIALVKEPKHKEKLTKVAAEIEKIKDKETREAIALSVREYLEANCKGGVCNENPPFKPEGTPGEGISVKDLTKTFEEARAAEKAGKGPSSEIFIAIESKPDVLGGKQIGKTHVVKIREGKAGDLSIRFESGSIFEAAANHPDVMEKLGVRLSKNGEILEYPDATALNARLAALEKTGDPIGNGVRFYSYKGVGEVPWFEFAKRWGDGEVPISSSGSHHFHDGFVHMLGWIGLPKELAERSQARMKMLLKLYEAAESPAARAEIKRRILTEVDRLDQATAGMASLLSGHEKSPLGLENRIEAQFESFRGSDRHFDIVDATPAEKQKFAAILKSGKFEAMPDSRVSELAVETSGKFALPADGFSPSVPGEFLGLAPAQVPEPSAANPIAPPNPSTVRMKEAFETIHAGRKVFTKVDPTTGALEVFKIVEGGGQSKGPVKAIRIFDYVNEKGELVRVQEELTFANNIEAAAHITVEGYDFKAQKTWAEPYLTAKGSAKAKEGMVKYAEQASKSGDKVEVQLVEGALAEAFIAEHKKKSGENVAGLAAPPELVVDPTTGQKKHVIKVYMAKDAPFDTLQHEFTHARQFIDTLKGKNSPYVAVMAQLTKLKSSLATAIKAGVLKVPDTEGLVKTMRELNSAILEVEAYASQMRRFTHEKNAGKAGAFKDQALAFKQLAEERFADLKKRLEPHEKLPPAAKKALAQLELQLALIDKKLAEPIKKADALAGPSKKFPPSVSVATSGALAAKLPPTEEVVVSKPTIPAKTVAPAAVAEVSSLYHPIETSKDYPVLKKETEEAAAKRTKELRESGAFKPNESIEVEVVTGERAKIEFEKAKKESPDRGDVSAVVIDGGTITENGLIKHKFTVILPEGSKVDTAMHEFVHVGQHTISRWGQPQPGKPYNNMLVYSNRMPKVIDALRGKGELKLTEGQRNVATQHLENLNLAIMEMEAASLNVRNAIKSGDAYRTGFRAEVLSKELTTAKESLAGLKAILAAENVKPLPKPIAEMLAKMEADLAALEARTAKELDVANNFKTKTGDAVAIKKAQSDLPPAEISPTVASAFSTPLGGEPAGVGPGVKVSTGPPLAEPATLKQPGLSDQGYGYSVGMGADGLKGERVIHLTDSQGGSIIKTVGDSTDTIASIVDRTRKDPTIGPKVKGKSAYVVHSPDKGAPPRIVFATTAAEAVDIAAKQGFLKMTKETIKVELVDASFGFSQPFGMDLDPFVPLKTAVTASKPERIQITKTPSGTVAHAAEFKTTSPTNPSVEIAVAPVEYSAGTLTAKQLAEKTLAQEGMPMALSELDRLGSGGFQTVYNDPTNPNKVLKVYDRELLWKNIKDSCKNDPVKIKEIVGDIPADGGVPPAIDRIIAAMIQRQELYGKVLTDEILPVLERTPLVVGGKPVKVTLAEGLTKPNKMGVSSVEKIKKGPVDPKDPKAGDWVEASEYLKQLVPNSPRQKKMLELQAEWEMALAPYNAALMDVNEKLGVPMSKAKRRISLDIGNKGDKMSNIFIKIDHKGNPVEVKISDY